MKTPPLPRAANSLRLAMLLAGLFFLQAGAEPPRGKQPVHPEKLLDLLPDRVEGWALQQSRGWMGESVWLQSTATREFREQLPEPPPPGRPPGITRLSLLDTGGFPGEELDLFAGFSPSRSSRIEYRYLDGHPAIILRGGDGRIHVQILLRARWILTVSMRHQEPEALERWFKRIDLAGLGAIDEGPVIDLPETVPTVSIDELDPGRSENYVAERGEREIPEEELEMEEETSDDPENDRE